MQLTVNGYSIKKVCRSLDSNRGPLVSALPTTTALHFSILLILITFTQQQNIWSEMVHNVFPLAHSMGRHISEIFSKPTKSETPKFDPK